MKPLPEENISVLIDANSNNQISYTLTGQRAYQQNQMVGEVTPVELNIFRSLNGLPTMKLRVDKDAFYFKWQLHQENTTSLIQGFLQRTSAGN